MYRSNPAKNTKHDIYSKCIYMYIGSILFVSLSVCFGANKLFKKFEDLARVNKYDACIVYLLFEFRALSMHFARICLRFVLCFCILFYYFQLYNKHETSKTPALVQNSQICTSFLLFTPFCTYIIGLINSYTTLPL